MPSPDKNKKYLLIFWFSILSVFVLVCLFITFINLGVFGPLPSFQQIENPKSNLASEVISDDGKMLGTYYYENRSNADYNKLSKNVINALIANEDSRFYEHSGIDFRRVLSIAFRFGHGGASTISQQLAKNLLVRRSRFDNPFNILVQKMKEWIVAIRLERNYTKEEIIRLYLNTVDFGNNAFGIKMAAQTYFNTSPDKLSISQAALLIGLVKGPSYYSATRNPARSLIRRNVVLMLIHDHSLITDAEYNEAKNEPLGLVFRLQDHNIGLAAYFREYLRLQLGQMLHDGTIPLQKDGTPYNMYRDGLKIYTTINSTMQQYAEQAESEHMAKLQRSFNEHWRGRTPWAGNPEVIEQSMKRSERYKELIEEGVSADSIVQDFKTPVKMKVFSWSGDRDTTLSPLDSIRYYKHFLRSAMMSMDPKTGKIKAWVGGINFHYFKYDEVRSGSTQVGSTFKPILYATAIEEGISPCFKVDNQPVTITGYGSGPWTPKNADGQYGGKFTIREALARSINVISAYLIKMVTPEKVIDMAKRLGISSEIPAYPSIALGTANVSLYDMVGAYSVFANAGVYTEPVYITHIEDKNGNEIYRKTPRIKQAMDEDLAYVMIYMLKGNTDPSLRGTGSKLRYVYNFTEPIGGKTGTTTNYSDGWYIGVTPDLVTGVWTGGEDRYEHFRSLSMGEGSATALPTWAMYMKQIYSNASLGISKGDFKAPTHPLRIEIDCSKYAGSATETPQDTVPKKTDERLDF